MRKIHLGAAAIMALVAHYTNAIAFDGCPVTPQGRQCIYDVQSKFKPLGKGFKGEDLYDHWVEAKYSCTPDIDITVKDAKKTTNTAGGKTNAGAFKSSTFTPDPDPTKKDIILECNKGTPATLPLADKTILDKIGWVEPKAAPAPANVPKFDLDELEHGCGPNPWIGNEYDLFRQDAKKMNIGERSLQDLRMTAADLSNNVASDETDQQQKRLDQYLLCVIKARIQQLESPPPKAKDLNRKALLQSLPRRGDGDGTALLKESVALAAEDPATKAARTREKEEQRRRDEAVLRQANTDYIQGVVTATASQIEQAQQTSGSTGSNATQGAASPSGGDCGTKIAHACK